MPKVKIVNEDKIIESEGMKNLLELLIENNIYIDSPCGGKGSCGKCLVKINNEPVYKLACQTQVDSDMTIELVSSKPEEETILVDGSMMELKVDPLIKKELIKPETLTYKSEALDKAINKEYKTPILFSHDNYKQLSNVYKENFDEITLTLERQETVLNIEPGDTRNVVYGIAIDIGTTTVAGYLWDLSKGEKICTSSKLNKQSPYGADVISRITYIIENEGGSKDLQKKALETVNEIIQDLCQKGEIDKDDIYHLSLVGNTTMNHLFWGFDPTTLGKSPYLPVTQKCIEAKAKDISIDINPSGKVIFLPSIAGFVGADTIGAALASQIDENKKELLIDLGTNGELVVTGNGKMIACSTAAGPAFEGAKISHGMQATSGAISRVTYEDNQLLYTTIGNKPPKGICGSGLMDIMAILIRKGVVDKKGKIVSQEEIEDPELAKRIKEDEKAKSFILAFPEEAHSNKEILLTQADIREVQLAKGAVAAGIQTLLNEANTSYEELEYIYLAGGFGNYVDVKSTQILGLIPNIAEEKIIPVGNAAGSGCQMALVNRNFYEEAMKLVDKIDHLELASKSDFQTTFMNSMYF
ncbi:ASKHA domain-containing protein [Natranaerofaba carboxydovora]|uniref:ASKHA domain-containing protein n=1 Tax=Natranaerofaba carboxydovora TaxID=2742683 RepID=UPI001F1441F9|nr:ASKHA domain-containing protein [Natranaerofaba carboxydovora]UMZ75470.1 hypothetical protein ACONDI_03099 [Natranaerofaba carboxydovora]